MEEGGLLLLLLVDAAANTVSGVDPLVRGISGRIRIVLNIAVVGFNSFTTRHNVSPAIQLLCGNVVQSLDITITIYSVY